MVSKYFCLLLLFTVLWCDAATSASYCRSLHPSSKEVECTTRDVILGWLHVTKRPALRAEAVKKNVSEAMQRAHRIRSQARVAIEEYKSVLASLKSTGGNEEWVQTVNQAISDVNKSIALANDSELNANKAAKEAEASLTSSAYSFSAIMRVACYLWNVSPDGVWNYTNVKTKLDQYGTDCTGNHNISKTLDNYAQNMENVDLAQWKNYTLQVLQETYDEIALNKTKYHRVLTNGNEKINEVKDAVAKAVERLEDSLKELELLQTVVNTADKKVEDASRNAKAANDFILASANGKVFCEIVEEFWKSDGELKAVEKTVMGAKQNAAGVVADSEQVQAGVITMERVVSDVAVWFKRGGSAFVHMFSSKNELDGVASGATKSSAAANASVRTATEASTIANEVQQKVKTESELLKRVRTEMTKMGDATDSNGAKVTFEACNDSVQRILKNKSSDAIRRIAEFNMTLLRELNNTLQEISSTTNTVGSNLSDLSNKVKEANSNAHDASLLAKQATENVKQIIVKVLSGIVTKLCAALSELRALHNKAEAFSVHAAHAQKNISEWLLRVDAAAKESDALVYLATSVEDAFATAEKRLEVLKRVLHRTDEQRGKVAGELAASAVVAEHSRNDAAQVNKTLRDVLANITSTVSATFSKDVCNASLMSEPLKLLSNMTDHPAVMSSLKVVAQLNRLADSMEGQVLKGRRLMRVAAASSAQVDAALEEVIRMARERSGKPQCPALYRQLLGALGLHW